ncbi:MAG: PTS IIA-like nitrogen regulatory protein PtsN [Gammaproteobacteria bacterium]
MNITSLLTPDRVVCRDDIASKKRLLELLAELLGSSAQNLPQLGIFDSLINREKLGSTGLGKGVALPHGRLAALREPVCAFVRVDPPVDFDATDGLPVDLVFSLLVPEDSTEEHLQVLSTIAEIFSDPDMCSNLRKCQSDKCLLDLLTQWDSQQISA